MLYRKIHKSVSEVLFALALLIFFALGDSCTGQKENKSDQPTLTVEAESFISNSGNISILNEKKNVVSIQTNGDEAWLSYKVNIHVSERYSIR